MIEAICFDLGDTLVAEETVIHNSCGQAITARVIEGVFEILETMRKDGYRSLFWRHFGDELKRTGCHQKVL